LLPRGDIAGGDVLLALASSGVHSNGFSLVRKVVADAGLGWDVPAPFSPDRKLGAALLEPTRIYVKSILQAIRGTGGVKALAHITGGGLTENLPRVLPAGIAADIDLSSFDLSPVFRWLSQAADIAETEMLRTFNCGVGMVVVAAQDQANAVENALCACGETVWRLGQLTTGEAGGRVRYTGNLFS
jgi:phosphoribosylformylglycinamidine cyclo-ligase